MNKLSVVITSRNDENNDLYNRTILCINSCLKTFDEVIFVDWNSTVPTLESISDNIFKYKKLKHIIVTPEQVKQIIPSTDGVPNVCQSNARNIGIRRCTGDIIVSTNIDIICPPRSVIDQFNFEKDTFYTIPRRNFNINNILKFNKIKDIQDYLISNMQYFNQEIVWSREITSGLANDNYSLINCCGDFQLAYKDIWYKIKGFEESMIYRNYDDTNVQIKAHKLGYNIKTIPELPVFHISHPDRLGKSKQNDWQTYGNNFTQTNNPDTWGFTNMNFKEELI
jgi:hypothetical protein